MEDLIGLFKTYNKEGNCKICLETWNGESKRFYLDLPDDMRMVTKTWGSYNPNKEVSTSVTRGTNQTRKAEILIALRKLLANKSIKIPNETILVQQLSVYREDDSKLKTDRVISLALATWYATDGKPKVTDIEMVEVTGW